MEVNIIKPKSVRARYVYSFLLIVIIPIVIFGLFFYQYNLINTETSVRNTRLMAFNQSIQQINKFINHLQEVAVQMWVELDGVVDFSDRRLYMANDSQILSTLIGYKNSLEHDVEAGFYLRGDTQIYFSDQKSGYAAFERGFVQDADMTMSGFFGKINSLTRASVFELRHDLLAQGSGNYLTTYLVPLPYLSTRPTSTAVFIFPQAHLTEETLNTFGDFIGDSYIFNHLGEVVYRNIMLNSGPSPQLLKTIRGVGVFPLADNDKSYVVLRGVSDDNGLTFITVMERRAFYQTPEPPRAIILSVVLLVLFCIAVAVMMAHYQYRPIRSLVADLTGRDLSLYNDDEFAVIRSVYRASQDDNIRLTTKVSLQSEIARDQFLLGLVQGKFSSLEEVHSLSEQLDMPLSFQYYMVLLGAVLDVNCRRTVIDTVIGLGKQLDCVGSRIYVAETGLDERIVCVCCFDAQPGEVSQLRELIAQSVAAYYSENGIEQTIWGVGAAYRYPMELRASHMEATAVLQSAFLGSNRSIYFYSSGRAMDSSDSSIPMMEQSLLIESIRHGDSHVALACFNGIVEQINQTSKSFLITQMLCFDILNVILKLLAQLNLDANFSDYKTTDTFRSLPEFQRQVAQIIAASCDEITQRRENCNIRMVEAVEQFIAQHFCDSVLSLDYISEALDLSKARINTIVREQQGLSFGQYIAELRMGEVKRRLRETDDQIQDIVTGVGYIDVPNYLRKFKSLVGVTPGQYRRLNREKAESRP